MNEKLLSKNARKIIKTLKEQVNQQYLKQAYDAGMLAYNSGRNDEAVEQLSKVVSMDEQYENGNALYNLAQAYRKLENWEKAHEYYSRVSELFPNTSLAYNAGRYAAQIGNLLEQQP